MLLNNYFNYRAYIDSHYPEYGSNISKDIGIKNMSNSPLNFYYQGASNGYLYLYSELLYNWCGKMPSRMSARVGEGTADPTPGDYELDSDITTLIGGVTLVVSTGANVNSEKSVLIITGTNRDSSTRVITEFGICRTLATAQSLTDTTLFVHEKLTEPITVQPGASFTITYEWTEA